MPFNACTTLFKQLESSNNKVKDTIDYIQTCVRHQNGIGDPIIVNFRAPLDDSSEATA